MAQIPGFRLRLVSVKADYAALIRPTGYDLQIRWLREQGVDDPYDPIKTNELSICMLSVCRDGS